MPMEELEERLWNVATKRSSRAGFEIAHDCSVYLLEFIQRGISRMVEEGYENDEARIRKAESNLKRLIDGMVKEAESQRFDMLHEPTFFEAIKSLCPLWPFC